MVGSDHDMTDEWAAYLAWRKGAAFIEAAKQAKARAKAEAEAEYARRREMVRAAERSLEHLREWAKPHGRTIRATLGIDPKD